MTGKELVDMLNNMEHTLVITEKRRNNMTRKAIFAPVYDKYGFNKLLPEGSWEDSLDGFMGFLTSTVSTLYNCGAIKFDNEYEIFITDRNNFNEIATFFEILDIDLFIDIMYEVGEINWYNILNFKGVK